MSRDPRGGRIGRGGRRALLLGLGLVAAGSVAAELSGPQGPVSLPRTEVRHIHSAANGVGYKLYVSLPRSFEEGGRAYPTVYLLDADYSFAIARGVVEHLVDRGDLPELVLVGVGYVGSVTRDDYRRHRSRDYTPVFSANDGYGPEYQKLSGGGPLFARFLAEELVPEVEAAFCGTRDRVLVGHSYGGLFAAWAMLNRPGLFQRYVVVSPSLWYRDHLMLDEARRFVSSQSSLPAQVFFAVGSRESNGRYDMPGDLAAFDAILASRPLEGFRSGRLVWDDETHNSVFPAALTRGLRFLWPRGSFVPAPPPP